MAIPIFELCITELVEQQITSMAQFKKSSLKTSLGQIKRLHRDKKHNLLGIVSNVGILDLKASSGKPINCDVNTVIINTS